MTMNDHPEEECVFCDTGRLVDHIKDITFHQYTDRGYVYCHVVIPIKICDHCGARCWDDRADTIMDDAVAHAYDMLK